MHTVDGILLVPPFHCLLRIPVSQDFYSKRCHFDTGLSGTQVLRRFDLIVPFFPSFQRFSTTLTYEGRKVDRETKWSFLHNTRQYHFSNSEGLFGSLFQGSGSVEVNSLRIWQWREDSQFLGRGQGTNCVQMLGNRYWSLRFTTFDFWTLRKKHFVRDWTCVSRRCRLTGLISIRIFTRINYDRHYVEWRLFRCVNEYSTTGLYAVP